MVSRSKYFRWKESRHRCELKPRKMRGQISQGMILSAEKDGVLQVVFAPDGMPNGSTVA